MSSVKLYIIRAINSFANFVSQPLAKKLAANILFKPARFKCKWPKDVKKVVINTSQGNLATYTYGEGKDVWLVHHWSKSSCELLPLIRKLGRQGFCVHALDLPAHGGSEGTHANLITMSQAFDDFAHESLMPHTIITHGLGAAVVANSSFFSRFSNNLVMLNPRLNVVEVMKKIAIKNGISEQTFKLLLQDIKRRHGKDLSNLNIEKKITEFSGHVKEVHEKAKLSTFSLIKQLA